MTVSNKKAMAQAELYYVTHGFAVLVETYDTRIMRIAAEQLIILANKLDAMRRTK